MEITFTTERTLARADEIVDYLRGPRLWIPETDYPDFEAWTAKVHRQLKSEAKRAILAYAGRHLVGAVIYQGHLDEPGALELKNITVRPDMQGRYVASFLLRNAEIEGARDYNAHSVLVDAKARNTEVRSFLLRHGYRVASETDLYALGAGRDIVYRKPLAS